MPPPAADKRNGRVSERSALAVSALPCAINIPFARSAVRFAIRTTSKGVTKEETFDYVLNRSLLINAAFITNTLRIREGKSTPMLREGFQRHPSKALSLLPRVLIQQS